eukprot:CAMPEP_0201945142 /NCGR_PEP_ID=MMETSP0903-20130614/53745_1 /ASSEMBLY_ACC=CAM_ASM_000552 /TAXON_ID=420261 /ORGANISM="Thalassiosira antarctica, Strain CCMP982" /LENGTH=801 /DNA_ID=CAMNT_0048488201 /DNA_START=85 /DNA_END=2487 /DNA_ORIENTATION=+
MTMLRHRSLALCFQRASPSRFQLSAFSSQSNSDGGMGVVTNDIENRVPKTLYRQLLSWCRRYDDIPFNNPLPPVTLSPPQVNPMALKRLKEMRSFLVSNKISDSLSGEDSDGISRFGNGVHPHPAHYAMYKEDVDVKENRITFPEIRDANELRAIIQSVYWLNNRGTIANIEGVNASEEQSDGGKKDQISIAFDAMKSCNELSSGELDSRRSKREFRIQVRQGDEFPDGNVKYHVGQVVKHKSKLWRGVIVGWDIEKDKSDGRLSSLTTKQYSIPPLESDEKDNDSSPTTGSNDNVGQDASLLKYTVLVDLNDAQSNNRHESDEGTILGKSITLESQGDLSPVDDPCLQRIHNGLIKQYFTKFDSRGHFVPNNILAYAFPLDRFSHCKYGAGVDSDVNIEKEMNSIAESKSSAELEKSCLAITKGVQEIGRRLLVPLSESNGQQQRENDDEASLLISSLASSAQAMMMENVSSQKNDSAISSLAKLYHSHVKINALLWTRNANRQQKQHINFSLGQIVKHKIYGFRGIIGAWDSKPRMDVSNWDGLKDVKNPNSKPFYHIYPDVNDSIEAFGGPRHFRYVCQDNLELSPHNEKPLELIIDLDPEEWKWDGERGRYIPSAEMKFMYAEDLGEHETTLIATVRNLKKILTDCLLEIRGGDNNDLFSMDDLFCQLQLGAENLEDATVVQDFIKEVWKESSNYDSRDQLDDSIADLLAGKHESALDTLSDIVAFDPLYGEAWNKKATVHYMMGEVDDSIRAAEEALKIDNRNFQALAGIGLIEMDLSQYGKAESAFRKCLAINPW